MEQKNEWNKIPKRAFEPYNGSLRGRVAEKIAESFMVDAEDVRYMNSKLQDRKLRYNDYLWKGKDIEVKSKLSEGTSFVFKTAGQPDFFFLIGLSKSEKKVYKFLVPAKDIGSCFSINNGSKNKRKRWNKYLVTTRKKALRKLSN